MSMLVYHAADRGWGGGGGGGRGDAGVGLLLSVKSVVTAQQFVAINQPPKV
jgi:hypothetical protein